MSVAGARERQELMPRRFGKNIAQYDPRARGNHKKEKAPRGRALRKKAIQNQSRERPTLNLAEGKNLAARRKTIWKRRSLVRERHDAFPGLPRSQTEQKEE